MFRRKEKVADPNARFYSAQPADPVPEIRFVRSDTHTVEELTLPVHPDDDVGHNRDYNYDTGRSRNRRGSDSGSRRPSISSSSRKALRLFTRSRSPSDSSAPPTSPRWEHGLSQLLHLDRPSSRHSNASSTSVNIPTGLPEVSGDIGDKQERESQWEQRATMLVQQNPQFKNSHTDFDALGSECRRPRSRASSRGSISNQEGDVSMKLLGSVDLGSLFSNGEGENRSTYKRLSDSTKLEVELEKSTQMFAKLADPHGENNALSQVLYGLALRHGWGCTQDPEKAVIYLSAAASNSAAIESEALRAGIKKGGAAKGELVLAIFELANCFRNGWGINKDPVAARQYYETAANLGDTDAMNEAAWCYLEGFGGKKDKYTAAKYYRLAEENGNKTLGNSWIWKEKYNPQ
ncbi:hypothetical protein MPDQ_002776 [Monascus purpureus]|uniref:HCP-like protein n=1 Tax=Monascus purpureus TaxID=5098 RepID=A0A507QZH3_MONPU|nr:hypothetical protein MPDQ_002776 [Monascus purpureus]